MTFGTTFRALLCSGCMLGSLFSFASGKDWPQYRGPDRNGEAPAMRIQPWSETGPRVVWERDFGSGFSEITVADNKLFTMFAEGEPEKRSEYAACLKPSTGEVVWKVAIDTEFEDEFGNGPRSTPAYDEDRLFVLSSRGRFMALNPKNGETLWDVQLTKDFGSTVPRWGFSTSPLIEGDLVIVETGALKEQAFAAFNKKSGELVWKAGDSQQGMSGYNSPIAATIDGKRQIIFAVGDNLTGFDLKGKQLWTHAWAERTMTIAMPLFIAPNRIFVSASGRGGGAVVELSKGDMQAKEVWKTRKIKNHFSSSVVYEGHIYGFDNATMKCMALEDGSQKWAKRGFGKGSVIISGDQLLILGDQGKLALAKADPESYQEQSIHQSLEGKSWTAPVLADGILYLRNHTQIAAYRLKP